MKNSKDKMQAINAVYSKKREKILYKNKTSDLLKLAKINL